MSKFKIPSIGQGAHLGANSQLTAIRPIAAGARRRRCTGTSRPSTRRAAAYASRPTTTAVIFLALVTQLDTHLHGAELRLPLITVPFLSLGLGLASLCGKAAIGN